MKPHLFRKGLRSAVLRPSTQNDPCGMMFLPFRGQPPLHALGARPRAALRGR